MRVAIISDTYYPDDNNVVNTISKLENEFNNMSITYRLYSPGDPNNTDDRHVFFKQAKVRFYNKLNFSFIVYKKFKKQLDAFRPDVIHIMSEGPISLLASKYAKEKKIPFVASYTIDLHNYYKHYPFDLSKRVYYKYVKAIHKSAYLNLVSSNYCIEQLESLGIDNNVKWSGGIDTKLYHPKKQKSLPETKRLLYVGKIDKDRNIETLIDIARKLSDDGYDFIFEIVGDGPMLCELEKQNVTNINWIKPIKGNELARKYRESDVFIFASEHAAYANAILEAMACGVPVIALYRGGVVDNLIDGFNGFAVEENDPELYVKLIKKLFSDEDVYLDMCRKARIHTLGSSWKFSAEKLVDYYIMALDNKLIG